MGTYSQVVGLCLFAAVMFGAVGLLAMILDRQDDLDAAERQRQTTEALRRCVHHARDEQRAR